MAKPREAQYEWKWPPFEEPDFLYDFVLLNDSGEIHLDSLHS